MTSYHKFYSQVRLVSLLFSTNSKLIPVLCLCLWCSCTPDKLLALCWVSEPLSALKILGHILPLPFLSLLYNIKPISASEPSTSVASLTYGTEQVISVVDLSDLSLWGLSCLGTFPIWASMYEPEYPVGVCVYFSTASLAIVLVL